jgi:hypothetical protein
MKVMEIWTGMGADSPGEVPSRSGTSKISQRSRPRNLIEVTGSMVHPGGHRVETYCINYRMNALGKSHGYQITRIQQKNRKPV